MMENSEPAIRETNRKHPKQLSDGMIMVLVASTASFPPLSTDLYLPALPTMSEQLKCPQPLVNLSLIVFFVFLSLSSIFWVRCRTNTGAGPLC